MQFAFIDSVHINNVDPGTNNITIEARGVLVNGAQLVNFDVITAGFVPSIANYVAAVTTALVNQYQVVFSIALPRASVVLPSFQNGQ